MILCGTKFFVADLSGRVAHNNCMSDTLPTSPSLGSLWLHYLGQVIMPCSGLILECVSGLARYLLALPVNLINVLKNFVQRLLLVCLGSQVGTPLSPPVVANFSGLARP